MPTTQDAKTRSRIFVAPSHKARFAKHVADWHKCRNCPLYKGRSHTALYRGHLPCDVLFIGEAPGPSEDALGVPFVGDAGRLLDLLVDLAFNAAGIYKANPNPPLDDLFKGAPKGVLSVGITNIVACFPRAPDPEGLSSGTIRPPNLEEAKACSPRLAEIITLATPRLIVTLGQEARKYLPHAFGAVSPKEYTSPQGPALLNLPHPSAMNRMENLSQRALAEKRFVLSLTEALEKL